MVYTKDEKLKIVKLYLEEGKIIYPDNVTPYQKDGIRKKVKTWVGVYKQHGEEGLEPKRKSYLYADKKWAIEQLLQGASKYQVAFQLGMKDRHTLKKWMRKYEQYGFEAFREDKTQSQRWFLKVTEKKERIKYLEQLVKDQEKKIKEQEVEINYLKKLIALVQEKESDTKISALSSLN